MDLLQFDYAQLCLGVRKTWRGGGTCGLRLFGIYVIGVCTDGAHVESKGGGRDGLFGAHRAVG